MKPPRTLPDDFLASLERLFDHFAAEFAAEGDPALAAECRAERDTIRDAIALRDQRHGRAA